MALTPANEENGSIDQTIRLYVCFNRWYPFYYFIRFSYEIFLLWKFQQAKRHFFQLHLVFLFCFIWLLYSPKVIPETSEHQARQTTESCARSIKYTRDHVYFIFLSLYPFSIVFLIVIILIFLSNSTHLVVIFYLMPTHERKYHLAIVVSLCVAFISFSFWYSYNYYFRNAVCYSLHSTAFNFFYTFSLCVFVHFLLRKRFLSSMLSTTNS